MVPDPPLRAADVPLRSADVPLRFAVASAALSIEGDGVDRADTVWDTFAAAGQVVDGSSPRTTPGSVVHDERDVAVLVALGVDSYRFGVSWPAVRPDGVTAAPGGADRYERLVDRLLVAGIRPVITLHHWDLPTALMMAGGWLARDTAARFADHAAALADRLGDRVADWITLVDPAGHAFLGHGVGIDAPGLTLLGGAFAAAHHQLLGHGLAVAALRAAGRSVRVGILNNHAAVEPAGTDPRDLAAARWYDAFHNDSWSLPVLAGRYPDPLPELPGTDLSVVHDGDLAIISAPIDRYGVRYEFPRTVAATDNPAIPFTMVDSPGTAPTGETAANQTAAGWPIVPSALTRTLTDLRDRHPGLPPLWVEVGAAFDDPHPDTDARSAFLDSHLRAVDQARAAGVPVAEFAWSHLFDGWEFAEGHTRRHGLVQVDPATGDRSPRPSLQHFADVIRARRDRPGPSSTPPSIPPSTPPSTPPSVSDGRMGA